MSAKRMSRGGDLQNETSGEQHAQLRARAQEPEYAIAVTIVVSVENKLDRNVSNRPGDGVDPVPPPGPFEPPIPLPGDPPPQPPVFPPPEPGPPLPIDDPLPVPMPPMPGQRQS